MKYQIAIDGPSGTGKSTVARMVADKLSILYVDTGAMYRAVAYYAHKNNIDYNNEELISDIVSNLNIELINKDNKQLLLLNGEDITKYIREKEISRIVPIIASYKKVREYMVKLQQDIAKKASVIMEGRDITSIVLPKADLKVYMTCLLEERARRRQGEYLKNGKNYSLEEIKRELNERDKLDLTRDVTPLVKTSDAIEVDTTNLNIEEVVNKIIELFKEKVEK